MWVTEVLPSTGERVDASTAEGRAWLADRYAAPDGRWVRLNMITSLTGSAVGSDGTSDTLTNRVDRAILGAIRADADAVVVGAQTVRAEGYVLPRRSRLVVVSASGDLTGHRLRPDPDGPPDQVIHVLGADAREPAPIHGATVLRLPLIDGRMPVRGILHLLAERGLHRLVCEGGPSLAAQFAAAGVVDEYCVTSAPTLVPAPGPFLPVAEPVPTRPVGVLVDEAGFSYLRLQPA